MPFYSYKLFDESTKIPTTDYAFFDSQSELIKVFSDNSKILIRYHRFFCFKNQLSSYEWFTFCYHMYYLLDASLTLKESLTIFKRHNQRRIVCVFLNDCLFGLEQGESLASIFQKSPLELPPFLSMRLCSSENSKALAHAFLDLSKHFKVQDKHEGELKRIYRYPLFLLIVCLCVILFFDLTLIPTFNDFLGKDSIPPLLDPYTLIPYSVGGFVIILCISFLKSHSNIIKAYSEHFLSKIPFIGPLYRDTHLIESLISLSHFLKNNHHLLASLEAISKHSRLITIQNEIQLCLEKVKKGCAFSLALQSIRGIPHLIIESALIGEKTGNLAEIFHKNCYLLQEDLHQRFKRQVTLLEYGLTCLMGVLILWIVQRTLLPFYEQIIQTALDPF